LSLIYEGFFIENNKEIGVILKIIRSDADRDLANNEIRTLKKLFAEEDPNQIHLATLLDQFQTKDKKYGIIVKKFAGYNLNQIRQNPLYQNGVPDYHVSWILCRILEAVGFAHSKGIIHCNIEPEHILIKPEDLETDHRDDHNVCLIDWSYASTNNSCFKSINDDYSAPEVFRKEKPLTASDLYSVGKCMVYLLNGNLENNSIPGNVEPNFKRFIENFLINSPIQRARNAWDMARKLYELRKELGWNVYRKFKF
jgi:serine/threonine protein kinase